MSPTTDAQARAAEAGALREAIQAFRGLGAYLERVFGTVPEDLVGYFGGDRLKVARAENHARILERSKQINERRGAEPEPISIFLALPLLVAAADESRDELVDLWARLLAAAADPTRTNKFRRLFIDTAKQMDPTDAIVLQAIARLLPTKSEGERMKMPRALAESLNFTGDEIDVSLSHLMQLDFLTKPSTAHGLRDTSFCREFLRAVND